MHRRHLRPAVVLVCWIALSVAEPGMAQAPPDGLRTPPQVQAADLTLEQRGDLHMARKNYREAVEAYRQALPQAKQSVIYNKIGIAYHHLLDFRAARTNYERALKADPTYAEAQNNIGAVYYAQKSYRRAVNAYLKALKMSPDSATVYSNLGTAYFARKRYNEAAKAYREAVARDPAIFDRGGTTGTILQERSIEERAKFHYYLAKTYAQAGLNERALEYVRKALEEGFKERQRFLEEPEFKDLQELPEFKQLIEAQIRVL